MARNLQNVFVIAILCIAVIFISGILLPRYLSNQYFQLRKELVSHGSSLKYSPNKNVIHDTAVQSQNESRSTMHLTTVIKTEKIQHKDLPRTTASLLQAPEKVIKRNKRKVPDDHKDLFSWNFYLNVSRHKNISYETTKNSSHENKLGVALHAKGEGQRQTVFDEMQNALRSVEIFLKSFFVKRIENMTRQEEAVKVDQLVNLESMEKESLTTKSEMETQNPDIAKFDIEGNGDESFSRRGREGKFLFGSFDIFGFRRKSIENISFSSEATTANSTEEIMDSVAFQKNEGIVESSRPPTTEFITENSLNVASLHSESLVSKLKNPEIDFVEKVGDALERNIQKTTEQEKCLECVTESLELALTSEMEGLSKSEVLETEPTAQDECLDCIPESLELTSETGKLSKSEILEIQPTESSFTDEILETFCMSLVNKVGESQHLSDAEEGNGVDSEHNGHNHLRSQQKPSVLDLITLFNSLQEESKSESGTLEDSFLVTTGKSLSQNAFSKERQAKFISFGNIFGFGSGRSAVVGEDESNELNSEELADGIIDLENLPSIQDCENYFRKKQSIKMFPKPNLMDMISDPKIQLIDFANATISPKLKEQQLQFLSDLLKTNLNNTAETSDKNFEAEFENTKPGEEGIVLFGNESNTTVNSDLFVNDEILTHTEFSSTDEKDNSTVINVDGKIQANETEIKRDSRFINIFGFGSGTDEVNPRSEDMRFLSFFGSGERSLGTSDSFSESESNEFGSGDAFKANTGLISEETLDNHLELTTINLQERIFWELPNFGGSGDLRQLAEEQEAIQTAVPLVTGNECENDCAYEIRNSSELSYDCDDYGCGFKSSHGRDNEELAEDLDLKNESDCDDDCYPVIKMDNSNGYDETVESTVANVNKNLTENLHGSSENCSCLHKDSNGNVTFSECDECSFNIMNPPNEFYESTESFSLEEIPEQKSEKSHGHHGSNCNNCHYENKLIVEKYANNSADRSIIEQIEAEKNLTDLRETFENCSCLHKDFDGNITFSQCDECNFDLINPLDKSHETSEGHLLKRLKDESETEFHDLRGIDLPEEYVNSIDRNMSFSECDECNSDLSAANDSYKSNENSSSEEIIWNKMNQTQLHENYGSDCHDCDHENAFVKQENDTTVKNITFSECDECNFSAIYKPDETYEITENYQPKSVPKNTNETEAYNDKDDYESVALFKDLELQNTATFSTGIDKIEENSVDETRNTIEDLVIEQTTEAKNRRFMGTIFLTGSGDGGLFGDSGGPINLVEEESTVAAPVLFSQRRARLDDILMSVENEPKELEQRNPIENEINLFQTKDTMSPILPFRKRARLDDTLMVENESKEFEHKKPVEHTNNLVQDKNTTASSVLPSRRRGRLDDMLEKKPNESDEENLAENSSTMIEEKRATVSTLPERRGRLDDIVNPCDDCDFGFEVLGESSTKKIEQKNLARDDISGNISASNAEDSFGGDVKTAFRTSVNEAFSSVIPPSRIPNSNASKASIGFPQRFCNSARDCNAALNERCLAFNSTSICTCSRGYVRHKETGKCVVKRVVQTSIKLPAEKFDEDLKNPSSPKYQETKKKAIDLMMMLLHEKPELLSVIAEIDVTELKSGSLIVILNLVFAVQSESEAKVIKNVETELPKALEDGSLKQRATLNISNASILYVTSEINVCMSSELNYCSVNAKCVWDTALRRYGCFCKEHYRDVSSNPYYVGETCIDNCPPDYCGPNGHCDVLENEEFHCSCSRLYFGNRCEIPGIYVLIVLGIVIIFSMTMLFAIIIGKRCRRTTYGETQTFRRSQETGTYSRRNDKVSDAIALEENIGATVSKFVNISTPMNQPPLIKVTRPTLNESSISMDYDSSFDETPTSAKK